MFTTVSPVPGAVPGIQQVLKKCVWKEGRREVFPGVGLPFCFSVFYLLSCRHAPLGLKKNIFREIQEGRWLASCDGFQLKMAPSLLGAPETSLSRARQGWQPWGQQAVREATGNSSGQAVPSLPRTAGERTRCSGLRSARPPCHPPLPPAPGEVSPVSRVGTSALAWGSCGSSDLYEELGAACFPGTLPATMRDGSQPRSGRLCDPG